MPFSRRRESREARLREEAQKKEVLFKSKMRSVEQTIVKFVRDLDKSKARLIEDANAAKAQGQKAQYANAVKALKITYKHQNNAKAMLSDLRISMQLRDISSMISRFMGAMGTVSQEINAITENTEFAGIQSKFEIAMSNYSSASDRVADFLDGFDSMLGNIGDDVSDISDAEIENMISSSLVINEDERDKNTDAKLNAELDRQIEDKLRKIESHSK